MNFSQVKAITIPEGSVKSITDSLGRILWKKPSSSIVLWEGTWYVADFSISPDLTLTLPDSGAVKLRITFSSLFENNGNNNYYKPLLIKLPDGFAGNKSNEEKVIDFDVPESYNGDLVYTYKSSSSDTQYGIMQLTKSGNSMTIHGIDGPSNANFMISMTKIEIVTDNTTIETRIYKDASTLNGTTNLPSTILRSYVGAQETATNGKYINPTSQGNILRSYPTAGTGFLYRVVSTDSVIRFQGNLASSSYYFKVYLNGTLVSENTGSTTNYYNYNVTKNTDLHYYINGNVTGTGNVELYLVES